MKRKKYLPLILIALLISLQLSSCKSKEEKAEEELEEFFEAIEENDFEKAKEKSTPETQKILVIVEKEKEKYKEENNEEVEVKFEITEREVVENEGNFKIKIIIGEKIKIEKIKMKFVGEKWLVIMRPKQISILRGVVFFNRYPIIFKLHRNNKYKMKFKYKSSKKKHSWKKHSKRKHSKKRH